MFFGQSQRLSRRMISSMACHRYPASRARCPRPHSPWKFLMKSTSRPLSEQYFTPQNWEGLRPGDRVTVSESKHLGYEAIVDVLTEDAVVIWLLPETGQGRRTFDHREAPTIRRFGDGS